MGTNAVPKAAMRMEGNLLNAEGINGKNVKGKVMS
jgi:hypothetical protein